MLSVENPPDPSSCSCKKTSPQLKNDELDSDNRALQEADLLRPGPSDYNLSNFSIRDHVFTARSKDIGTNWPFPHQYLQLCLKHGIKDPLPPFEPPDSVRNPCFRKASGSHQEPVLRVNDNKGIVEVGLLEKENVDDLDERPYRPFDQSILGSSGKAPPSPLQDQQKLIVCPTDTNLCISSPGLDQVRCEADIPSAVISHAPCARDSVPTNRLPCLAQEDNTWSEASVELEIAGPPCSSQPAADNKCRLIVKLGIISDPTRTEDNVSNTSTISEPMASKVCPVCKTFSSTSNTTLNAHIDQCLAAESTSMWDVNSKLGKHRVKPRKKRSMVDICATAPHCTLEELDRRNGSNWAVELSLPSTHSEFCTEGKRQRLSRMDLDDNGENCAVYFDSNGTKLRILSKFNEASVSTAGQDSRPRKHVKCSKDNNNYSTGKRRRIARKHSKYLKLKPEVQVSHSLRPHRAEIVNKQIYGASERKYGMEENPEKEESLSQLLKARDQIRLFESGALGPWICSKRSSLSNKFCGKDGDHGPECSSHVTRGSLIDSDQRNISNSFIEKRHILKLSNSSEDPTSALKKKRVRSLSHAVRLTDNRQKSSKQLMSNLSRLSTRSTSSTQAALDGCVMKFSRSLGNYASSHRSKRLEIHRNPVKNANSLAEATPNQVKSCHLFSAVGKKPSTLRKNMLLAGPVSPRSKLNENEKHSAFKKSQVHRSIAEIVDQVGVYLSDVDEQCDLIHIHSENQSGTLNQIEETHKLDHLNNMLVSETEEVTDEVSIGEGSVIESGQERVVASALEREEPLALGSLQLGPDLCGLNPDTNVDSRVAGNIHCTDNAVNKFDGRESAADEVVQIDQKDTIIEIFPDKAVRGPIRSSSKILAPVLHKLGNHSDIQSNSMRSLKEHKRPVCGTETQMGPTEPSLSDDQEMGSADEVGSCIIRQNTHTGGKLNCAVRSENSHAEVDKIPVPEPPGSFLPSSGGSEVLQEGWSLTSSRVLSSQDQHVLVDRDSSGSPVSATSTISYPHMERFGLKYSELESSVGSPAIQDRLMSNFSYCSNVPVVGDATKFPCTVSIGGAERTSLDGENLKVTVISPSRGPLKFSAVQPCCCSRKEGFYFDAALAYQESQFPRQSTMSPAMLPAKGKQMSSNLNITPEMFTSFSTCPSSRNDEMMARVLEFPTGHVPVKNSLDAAVNFPSHDDSDSASPSSQAHRHQSTSNPVLRLMGKNLMVVNKEENMSMQLGCSPPEAANDCPNVKYLTLLGFSDGNAPNQAAISAYHMAHEGSVIFNQDPCHTSPQFCDVGFSNGFRNDSNSEAHQALPPLPVANCQNNYVGGFAASSLKHHGLKGRMNLQSQPKRSNNKSNSPFAYNVERVVSTPHPQHRSAASAVQAVPSPFQEVIIIDDSPENEADSRMNTAKCTEGSKGSQQSPVGILTSNSSDSKLRQVNPFPCYQSQNAFTLREPPVGLKSSFLVSCPKGANAGPVKQRGTSAGSSVLLRSPFIIPHP